MKENQTIAQFLGITKFPYEIKNDQGNKIYSENSNGNWWKADYDANGNEIYSEDSTGYWWKGEYDANGNETKYENSNGFWWKKEYDAKGNRIFSETSNGYWWKKEYDANGNEIYSEDSNGNIIDNRPKQVELTLAEIASKLNIPLEQLRIKD